LRLRDLANQKKVASRTVLLEESLISAEPLDEGFLQGSLLAEVAVGDLGDPVAR
jgi:hypothetical protein